jgi:hypothetical protein
MAFKQLSDYDYLKAVLYLERMEELDDTYLDKQTKWYCRIVQSVINLHDEERLHHNTIDVLELMRVKSGYDFIKTLKG